MAHPHEAVPTLRVSDAPAAAAWYARLGFAEDWRHPHAAGLHGFIRVLDPDGHRLRISPPTV